MNLGEDARLLLLDVVTRALKTANSKQCLREAKEYACPPSFNAMHNCNSRTKRNAAARLQIRALWGQGEGDVAAGGVTQNDGHLRTSERN
jgi:hypothetical protein